MVLQVALESTTEQDLQVITTAQVQTGARRGESWDEARERLWWESQQVDGVKSALQTHRPVNQTALISAKHLVNLMAHQRLDGIEQMTKILAHRQLSGREQFLSWWPSARWMSYAELLESPLVIMDLDWEACVERLPDSGRSPFHYLVHTPFDQWLTLCLYAGDGAWARVSDGSLLSGARHWRVALEQEKGSRSVTRVEYYALARLSRVRKQLPFEEGSSRETP